MVRVAILASGSGTNAERLMKAIGALSEVEVALVGTNKAEAGVMHRAKACGVSTWVFTREDLQAGVVAERLKQHRVDFVALAGFLLKVPDHLVQAFSGRILNLHPSLLPAFGGRGMYGRHVHEAVYKALVQQDVTETGITLHWVDADYDTGPPFFQAKTALEARDTPASIAEKIQVLERNHYASETLRAIPESLSLSHPTSGQNAS